MEQNRVNDYILDAGPMGPIGEGEALILRVTRNCPWNRCLFCPVYKNKKFRYRSVAEVKDDIDTVRRIKELVEETSWRVGFGGRMPGDLLREIIRAYPDIYGRENDGPNPENAAARYSLSNVINWLMRGEQRVFLQDANSLIMRPGELTQVLQYLKEAFPTVKTITSYARSKTCAQRSAQELRELREAGLSWLFVGIESGSNEVLGFMRKGVTAEEHINAGKKVMQSGIHLAAFAMPGLAGSNGKLSDQHVSQTARVLNDIRPTEVRIRSLAVLEDTPLYARWASREFHASSEDQMIDEIRLLIENLDFDCTIETLQMTNVLFNVRGKLSALKDEMLAKISQYKAMAPMERFKFRLSKYIYGGYLDCVMQWGKFDSQLGHLIQEAIAGVERESHDAGTKTEQAIFALKSKGVP
jgi:hypothetical protein